MIVLVKTDEYRNIAIPARTNLLKQKSNGGECPSVRVNKRLKPAIVGITPDLNDMR